MRTLETETNIEILREYSGILLKAVSGLEAEVSRLRYEQSKKAGDPDFTPASQEWLTQGMADQLSRLKTMYFGFGRESLPAASGEVGPPVARSLGHEQQKLLLLTARAQVEPTAENAQAGAGKKAAQHKPSPQILHDISLLDLITESLSRGLPMNAGAEAWQKQNGLSEDTVEITVTERIYTRVVHQQAKYRLRDEYNTSDKEVIITAPGPVKVKPGMTYSVDFCIAVAIDKYEYHLPLERQRRKMEAAGFEIDVKTLYSHCASMAEHCTSVLAGIGKDIQSDYAAVHLDETPWRILKDKTHGQLWVMSNRMGCYYQFEPSRAGAIAQEILGDYEGAVICDAYSGYTRLAKRPGIRVQKCWSHARREFFERFGDYPTECRLVIELMDRILALEYEAKSIPELHELRRMKSRPLIDELRALLISIRPRFLPEAGISKAINYCMNHWKGLTHFLSDSTVNLTNNDAERAIRHAVMGRKNFLGSQTIDGADTMAALYTVIETAKRQSLQPAEYLKYLVTERWYKREPLTPKGYADQKFGPNTAVNWPPRSEWQISDARHA